MSLHGIHCDICGAPDCLCGCLEELRAAFPRGVPESEPARFRNRAILVGVILTVLVIMVRYG